MVKSKVLKAALVVVAIAGAEVENIFAFKWFMRWYESQLPKTLEEALSATKYYPPREAFLGMFILLAVLFIPATAYKIVDVMWKQGLAPVEKENGLPNIEKHK